MRNLAEAVVATLDRHGEAPMNGMHQEEWVVSTSGSDDLKATHHYLLPPTPTCAQITLGDYYEFDDQSHGELGFMFCRYLDSHGLEKTDIFQPVTGYYPTHVFARMNLIYAEFELVASNAFISGVLNFFFWNEVS
jgi:hypothetical protein